MTDLEMIQLAARCRDAQIAATQAYHAATSTYWAVRGSPYNPIKRIWHSFVHRTGRAGITEQLELAEHARTCMEAFFNLSPPLAAALAIDPYGLGSSGLNEAGRRAFRSAMAEIPGLAEFQADHDAALAEAADQQARQLERDHAVAMAAMPKRIIDGARARGIELALNKESQITAPAGAVFNEADLGQIGTHKAGIVALLRAAAAASRPVVLA